MVFHFIVHNLQVFKFLMLWNSKDDWGAGCGGQIKIT